MSDTLVWAFKPIAELNHETGFVQCDEALAAQLIAAGKAQDTRDGALCFNEIEEAVEKHSDADRTDANATGHAQAHPGKGNAYGTKVMAANKGGNV